MTGRTSATDAILAFRRSAPLRLLRLLSKTASSTTLIDSKTPWRNTSNAAIKSSSSCARPRTRLTVRAMRLTRPLKRFRASARVSPRPVATAWLPLRFRVPSRAPMSSTLRLTRQSDLASAARSLLRCWHPMTRRRRTTFSRGFSRRWRSVRVALPAYSMASWMFGDGCLWDTETSRARPTSLWMR